MESEVLIKTHAMPELASPVQRSSGERPGNGREPVFPSGSAVTPEEMPMSKSIDVLAEVIRNPKRTLRQVEARPNKPTKHRYERRRVREFLKLSDWDEQAAT